MANEKDGYPPIRRVVTGHDAKQVAKILIDGPAISKRVSKSGGVSTLIWCTDRKPADIGVGENIEDMGARVLGTPPPNGTRFTVNDIPRPGAGFRAISYLDRLKGGFRALNRFVSR